MTALAETIASEETAGIGRRGDRLSIMIPTFNCADYLRQTLASLRQQEDQIADAQIAIVDDASFADDPRQASEESWPGRANFIRQPRNVGLVANFNDCLQLAERPWVHILHGDDVVLPGAYAEFHRVASLYPQSSAIFGRSVFMEARGFWRGTTPFLGGDSCGLLSYKPMDWISCPVQCAGVLIRPEEIRRLGGFDPHFSHSADWNLWWRIARTGRAAYTNCCVGGYRMYEGNHSSTLRRSGANLREGIDQIARVAEDCPADTSPRQIWAPMVEQIGRQCRQFENDAEAYAANLALLDLMPPAAVHWRTRARLRRKRPKCKN
ncbi:MAG: glycosyltransferase family A protein [Tepidisphaeraceae bacterium]|jgi:GT2 family glycosyltransferase